MFAYIALAIFGVDGNGKDTGTSAFGDPACHIQYQRCMEKADTTDRMLAC